MNVMIRPRRGGKTHAVVDIMRKNPNAYLVVRSTVEKALFEEQIPEASMRILTCTSPHSLKGKFNYSDIVIVDNFEFLLEAMLGIKPAMVTATGVNI